MLRTSSPPPTRTQWDDWRWQVRNRLRSGGEVLDALGIERPAPDIDVERRFPAGVTPYYLSLVDPRDPADPILRQILPAVAEGETLPGESDDPFLETERSPVPGVIHRYPDRALIVPTNFCATLCRHCFRKRTWADGFFMLGDEELARAVEYVRENEAVRDVLITGGDPLHLRENALAGLLRSLRAIERLDVLRVATRTPVTLPQRFDRSMLDLLASVRPLWLITHFNCAREVTPEAVRSLRALIDRGITVQNQAVLLAGVNDDTCAQIALSRALLRAGVRPYYLHVADPVSGTGHFRVPLGRAREIVRGMYGRISGLGIPRLVLDLPGGRGKVPVGPSFEEPGVAGSGAGYAAFRSPIDGGVVRLSDPPPRATGGP